MTKNFKYIEIVINYNNQISESCNNNFNVQFSSYMSNHLVTAYILSNLGPSIPN